jgi:sortase A
VAVGTGRVLVGVGALLLAFLAYQLWGTRLAEARAQHDLRRDFEAALPTPTATTTEAQPLPTGEAVAIVRIPTIGVDKAVVEGVGVPDLKKGPGHYPQTPMPGQPGNAAIAGHRTTYGAPFSRLDELDPGDEIRVTTRQGRFRFQVERTQVVKPNQVEVLAPPADGRAHLTLTTCNPRYSARERLVVHAVLVGEPAPPTTTTVAAVTLDAPGLSGDRQAAGPTVRWALACLALALATWFASRRWRRWPAYLVGGALFLAALFALFENVSRLLPANI